MASNSVNIFENDTMLYLYCSVYKHTALISYITQCYDQPYHTHNSCKNTSNAIQTTFESLLLRKIIGIWTIFLAAQSRYVSHHYLG